MKLPKSFRTDKDGKLEQLIDRSKDKGQEDPFYTDPKELYSMAHDLAYHKKTDSMKALIEDLWRYTYDPEDGIFKVDYYFEYGADGSTITWSALELYYCKNLVLKYDRDNLLDFNSGLWEEELLQLYKKEGFTNETA